MILIRCILVLLVMVVLTPQVLAASSMVGTVTQVDNTVQYKRENGSAWLGARKGTKLYNNDKVRTLENSKVVITLIDGKLIKVPSLSTMTLQVSADTITIDMGKAIYKLVKGKEVVAMNSARPVATAGVLGMQGAETTATSPELLQIEDRGGQSFSMREDGSITPPAASGSMQGGISTINPAPIKINQKVQDIEKPPGIRKNIPDNVRGFIRQ